MGMSCFFDETWMRIIKVSCFFRSFLPPAVANPMFCVYLFAYFADICVVLRCALQSVACSS